MEVEPSRIELKNSNSMDIVVLNYLPSVAVKGIIVFTSAMGVKQHYYRHYSKYLASEGYEVYTFDYTDIGDSRNGSIKKSKTTVFDWIDDIKIVTDYVFESNSERADEIPFYYLTHSLGGQLFGFLGTQNRFKALIGITSQNGYWRFYKTKLRYFLFWYLIMVPITKMYGYFPGKKLKFGEDLPPKVAKRWKKWCTSRNYFFDDEEYSEKSKYTDFKGDILTISFEDDPWATVDAVNDLYERYSNAEREHQHIHPKDVKMKKVGHVGFFRLGSEDLWKLTTKWLESLN